jgi:hypothetical protein
LHLAQAQSNRGNEAIIAYYPFALTMRDELHSDEESRFIMLAAIGTGAILFVVFTVRAQDVIRLISARAATRREKAIYEEAK